MRTTYLLSRKHVPLQNIKKVPWVPDDMPLKLRNHVSSKGTKAKDQNCTQEITSVIACLSANRFENNKCINEVSDFQDCYKRHLNSKRQIKLEARSAYLPAGAKNLRFNQLNILLARYPEK